MTSRDHGKASRRGFLKGVGVAAAAGASLRATDAAAAVAKHEQLQPVTSIEPFHGLHQAGILTAPQHQTYFAAFDIITDKPDAVRTILRNWTAAAEQLSRGQAVEQPANDTYAVGGDTAEAMDLAPARLTLTFGFGPGLFIKDGKDRFGLAARRPEALIDLPRFAGDQLVEGHTGGDLSVQACADDPQVAFHAVRQLARLASGVAALRWTQTGFLPNTPSGKSPRNLMGFRDGTNNPSVGDTDAMQKFIWADAPGWMNGGSYLVARRIRIALEHWDRMALNIQEQYIGRQKYSGAPLGAHAEHDPVNLEATDKDGNFVIAGNAHVRLANEASNDGARILRRSYSYNDGANFVAERWPPWRQGVEYDAGLFFACYQRDPRTGFVKIFDRMAKLDMMNQFVTHVGGGLFACPGGIAPGEFIGQRLFDA
ncbi:MAG TPA: iron uptake transporter deferrochelatase/peroxidase subunit [Rhizomicrobium sp.]